MSRYSHFSIFLLNINNIRILVQDSLMLISKWWRGFFFQVLNFLRNRIARLFNASFPTLLLQALNSWRAVRIDLENPAIPRYNHFTKSFIKSATASLCQSLTNSLAVFFLRFLARRVRVSLTHFLGLSLGVFSNLKFSNRGLLTG